MGNLEEDKSMGEAAAREPTMEDILSSIRKIIAEEGEESGQRQEGLEPGAPGAGELDDPVATSEAEFDAGPEVPEPAHAAQSERETPVDPVEPMVEPQTGFDPGMTGEASGYADELASATGPAEHVEPMEATPADDPLVDTTQGDVEPQMVSRSLADIAASAKALDEAAEASENRTTVALDADEPVGEFEPSSPEPMNKPDTDTVRMEEAIPAPREQEIVEAAAESSEAGAFKGALMSPRADGAVSGSFERLKRSVMDDLEAKTEAILRPMLREWLDENLPNLVERLVREEIERVARGN